MAKHILLINGPNLNLLGLREPHIYGTTTLSSLEASLRNHCASLSPPVHLTTYQSNHEGAIIDMIHRSRYPELVPSSISDSAMVSQTAVRENNREKTKVREGTNGIEKTREVEEEKEAKDGSSPLPPVSYILINPGALTHTSVALRDALAGVDIPFLEIHITNVHAREDFRHKSYLSDKAVAVVCGLGVWGYRVAVDYCVEQNVGS